MKKQVIPIILISMLLTSCALFHKQTTILGKSTKAEEKSLSAINNVEANKAVLNNEKLNSIGVYSFGVDYSLGKSTNNTPQVDAAIQLNERVVSLANQPTLDEKKDMVSLADKLMTNNAVGKQLLNEKDNEIQLLTEKIKQNELDKQKAIKKYIALANKTAAEEDSVSAQLSEYKGWFGLRAVFMGLLQFIRDGAWFLGISGVIFFVLRYLSFTNPIAAEIFSIFSKFGSWAIKSIEYIIPKSVNEAELVTSQAYDALKTEYESLKTSVIAASVKSVAPTISGSKG